MAIIRFLLAISVVLIHLQWFIPSALHGYTLLPGIVAVQSFFIISGFYMSLIINEKYNRIKRSYFFFITNRFLRIYPIYFLVLIVFLLYNLSIHHIPNFFQTDPLHSTLAILKNSTLIFSPDYFIWLKSFYNGLYLGQAWTLGIELLFYLLAPFIVKRNLPEILILLLLSFIVRTLIWHSQVYPEFNADYFFLPNFVFFTLGILSYKLGKILPYQTLSSQIKISIVSLFILFTLSFLLLPEFHHIKQWFYFFSLMAVIPILFSFDSLVKTNLLGDISYPIYISHLFVLTILNDVFKIQSTVLMLGSVVLFAIVIHYLIAKPVDKVRALRIQKKSGEDIE